MMLLGFWVMVGLVIQSPVGGSAQNEVPRFAQAITPGRLNSGAAREISGLVRGRRNPKAFWAHNDSGDIPRLFAFGEHGETKAELRVENVTAEDWEDLAILTRNGQHLLLIGDIGDNLVSRRHVMIYGVAEPALNDTDVMPELNISPVFQLKAHYPDGPRNAETLLADPHTNNLYVIEKNNGTESGVYRLDLDHWQEPYIMKRVATIRFGTEPLVGSTKITGGDIRADGGAILLRTYGRIFWWRREMGGSIAAAFGGVPIRVPNPLEKQGEAIAFLAGKQGYATIGEGLHPSLWFFFQYP